jgi:hypothetical protein
MGALTTAAVLLGLAACPVEPLPTGTLAAGDAEVESYREDRRVQFGPDLMGYRDGPALGRPSARERRTIRSALRFRRTFGLNDSRLLIRRLLRDRSPAVRRTAAEYGTPLAPLEQRELEFRIEVQNSTRPVHRYVARCARAVSGGIHLDQRDPLGIRVVVSVVAGRARHLEALSERYRLRSLLRVRRVRFTERRLRVVQDRLGDDFDELQALGVDMRSTTLSIARNRVIATVVDASPSDRRLLRRRYGPPLRIRPLR